MAFLSNDSNIMISVTSEEGSVWTSVEEDSLSNNNFLTGVDRFSCLMQDGCSPPPSQASSFRHGGVARQVKIGFEVGKGSYGTVFQGLKGDNGKLLAVKQFSVAKKREILDCVAKEFETLRTLKHRNIVRQFGFYCNRYVAQIFMEYVPGGSVHSLLKQFGHLHEMTIAKYIKQVLQGLKYLHHHGVIHRDIKPSNLLLGVNGNIKLSDFGTSLSIAELPENGHKSFCGTIPYASHEALRDLACLQSDIWSVGCTICEMASGATPWSHLRNMLSSPNLRRYILDHTEESPEIPEYLSQNCKDFIKATFHTDAEQQPSTEDLLCHAFLDTTTKYALTVEDWVKLRNTTDISLLVRLTRAASSRSTERSMDSTKPTVKPEVTQKLKELRSQVLNPRELDHINLSRLLYSCTIDAATLAQQFPPIFHCHNKKVAYDIATGCKGMLDPDGKYPGEGYRSLRGNVEITRWDAFHLPTNVPPRHAELGTHYIRKEGMMSYDPIPVSELPPRFADRKFEVWHMNFADRCLFQNYGTENLHQDVLQVLMHPILSSVAEMLRGSPHRYTVELDPEAEAKCHYVQPTPILLRNVERRVNLKVDHDPEKGCQNGALVDGAFDDDAPEDIVFQVLEVVDPPTMTNLIAVAAPWAVTLRSKRYTPGHILSAFIAIYTAYRAAVLSTRQAFASKSDHGALQSQANPESPAVLIYTGNWGTGAYGGNRQLMALLQLIAAHMAEVDVLVFHTYKLANCADYSFAMATFHSLVQQANGDTGHMLDLIHNMGFNWQ